MSPAWAQTTTTVAATPTTVSASTTTSSGSSTTSSTFPPAALCQQMAARQAGGFVTALLACEEKHATAVSRGREFDRSACVAHAEKVYEAGIPERVAEENCPACIADQMEGTVQRQECLGTSSPHCDPLGGKPALRCGKRMTRLLSELVERLVGCHVKAARNEVLGKTFDEERCERKFRREYDRKVGELRGCPSCLVNEEPAECWSRTVRLNNNSAYCDCMEPGRGRCDDGNPCTTDTCEAHKCAYKATNGSCPDDRDPCTKEGRCEGSACVYDPMPRGTACEDDDPCDGAEECDAEGHCSDSGPEPLACEDSGNPCVISSCKPRTGCVREFRTGRCEDGNACTLNEMCTDDGTCFADDFVVCDDRDPCTQDSCSSLFGCIFTLHPRCR